MIQKWKLIKYDYTLEKKMLDIVIHTEALHSVHELNVLLSQSTTERNCIFQVCNFKTNICPKIL